MGNVCANVEFTKGLRNCFPCFSPPAQARASPPRRAQPNALSSVSSVEVAISGVQERINSFGAAPTSSSAQASMTLRSISDAKPELKPLREVEQPFDALGGTHVQVPVFGIRPPKSMHRQTVLTCAPGGLRATYGMSVVAIERHHDVYGEHIYPSNPRFRTTQFDDETVLWVGFVHNHQAVTSIRSFMKEQHGEINDASMILMKVLQLRGRAVPPKWYVDQWTLEATSLGLDVNVLLVRDEGSEDSPPIWTAFPDRTHKLYQGCWLYVAVPDEDELHRRVNA